MTQNIHVDVAIIGAGTAGLSARRSAKAKGASVVMIDSGPFGTTCARVGCMPSKLLIAAADAAHQTQNAHQFGVHAHQVTIDGKAVLARVQSERDRFVGFVNDVIDEAKDEQELVVGLAQVIAPGVIEVALNSGGQTQVHYKKLVVASGSTPFIPPPFRGLDKSLLTTEDIFELPDLPESLLVIGLGVIGLEIGQAMSRLGVRTTLLGVGGAVGPLSDPKVLECAKNEFAKELDLHPDYELKQIEAVDSGIQISFVDSNQKERCETFERIFIAAGRKPNLQNLGLDTLEPPLDDRGQVAIDPETLQLGQLPVFVAGDVNNLHPLLHEAADDGFLAGKNAVDFPQVFAGSRRTPLGIVFSDPQMAVVGQSYRELKSCQSVAGEVSYEDQGRARVHGFNRGLVRIYADLHSGVLIGAELFGPRVEHLSHLLAWAIQKKTTVDEALAMPFYHPTIEEGLRTAFRDLNVNLRHGAPIKCRVSELGPGS